MGDAAVRIEQRHVANCTHADAAYGHGVATVLGREPQALAKSV